MQYKNIIEGRFLERPNRFIARVAVEGEERISHVKNTGRCRELLKVGAKVYLSVSDNMARKTALDLVTVIKDEDGKEPIMINMDSQAPNELVAEWLAASGLFSADARIRREVSFGDSRFDFSVTEGDRISFLEVKGVTLECGGVAKFPDAPTERGVKHLNELIRAKEEGYGAFVVFVIQMKGVERFVPNSDTDPEFATALLRARRAGVHILAVDCLVTPDTVEICDTVPLGF